MPKTRHAFNESFYVRARSEELITRLWEAAAEHAAGDSIPDLFDLLCRAHETIAHHQVVIRVLVRALEAKDA